MPTPPDRPILALSIVCSATGAAAEPSPSGAARPETVALGSFPIFIVERGPNDVVYGFPDFEERGVKAAPHNHGRVVGPDDWGPQAGDDELDPVRAAFASLVPGAAGPVVDRDVCLYTNTLPADRRPDAGEEFIIDRWPDSRLIVCSACSGHGAKFAPAIGQRLARLAIDPSYRPTSFPDTLSSPERPTPGAGFGGRGLDVSVRTHHRRKDCIRILLFNCCST